MATKLPHFFKQIEKASEDKLNEPAYPKPIKLLKISTTSAT